MRCLDPRTMIADAQHFAIPCGQCIRCRIQRREEKTGRIMMEWKSHGTGWFVTLTYSDEHIVLACKEGSDPVPTVWKGDHQRFMKRFRRRFPTERIRFFCVGEYGLRMGRPHYHYCLFGPRENPLAEVAASWDRGFTTCDELTPERARYAARYTVKKATLPTSFGDGREPEFMLSSKHPALGAQHASKIGRSLARNVGWDATIPLYVSIGGKQYILDRYLRSVIEKELGYPEIRHEARQIKATQDAPGVLKAAKEALAREPELLANAEADYKARQTERGSGRKRRTVDGPPRGCQSSTGPDKATA